MRNRDIAYQNYVLERRREKLQAEIDARAQERELLDQKLSHLTAENEKANTKLAETTANLSKLQLEHRETGAALMTTRAELKRAAPALWNAVMTQVATALSRACAPVDVSGLPYRAKQQAANAIPAKDWPDCVEKTLDSASGISKLNPDDQALLRSIAEDYKLQLISAVSQFRPAIDDPSAPVDSSGQLGQILRIVDWRDQSLSSTLKLPSSLQRNERLTTALSENARLAALALVSKHRRSND